MTEQPIEGARLPLRDRLWFKVTALFAFVFLATFIAGWFYDAVTSIVETRALEESAAVQPQTVPDAKIEAELAKVMTTDMTPDRAAVRDPFVDRGNLAAQNAAALTVAATAVQPAANTVATQLSPTQGQYGAARTDSRPAAATTVVPPDPASVEATLERIRARERTLRDGREAAPESTIFAIEDLKPVGVVSGGTGNEEVLFHSKALDRIISFPIGARFFDGWLIGLRPDGVEFGAFGATSVRFKSWGYGE